MILIFAILFLYVADHDFSFFYQNLTSRPESQPISIIHNAAIIFLTFVIAWGAWSQLGGILETGRADFLLRLDQRFGDQYIIKARIIIHEFYMESKNINKNHTELQHSDYIADRIYELGEDETNKKSMK